MAGTNMESSRARAYFLLQSVAVFCVYYAAARLGLSLNALNTFAAAIWPPTGIALAVIFFGGYRFWPSIRLAAFTVNVASGAPIFAAMGIALGNTLEAVVGVQLLRFFNFDPLFARIRDSLALIVVALGVPIISAIVGPISL